MNLFLATILSAIMALQGGDALPRSIKVTAPLNYVYCSGPVCCGEVTVIYRGYYYGNPRYCKWFKKLTNGQRVTTTVYFTGVES